MFVSEEGKYQIWFTQNDSFFKNIILFFRRIQPNAKDEIQNKISLDKKGHFLLPTDENKYTKLNLISDEIYGNLQNCNDQIHFSWVWENLKKSYYVFSGQLGNKDKPTKIKSEAIPSDKDIQRIISDVLPEWNNEKNRYSIRFDQLKEESKRTFEEKHYECEWEGFKIQIQNLPLMPYDKEEAKKWRNWLLNEELKKEYFSMSDFDEEAIELNEKEALAAFSLDIPKIKDYIEKTESKKVFWHLQAPIDLNPNAKIKLSAKPVELKQGDKLSFADIVAKLGLENCSVFVYYDRYVYNHNQQRAVSALAKAINSPKKIVITDLTSKENISDFIQKNVKEIKLRDSKTIFKGRSPHDRYLITSNQNEMSIWNISNSIDYISFSDYNINESIVGTIRQSVVFTPISKEMLDKDLLNFINNEVKNGK
ncbi:MAG TPA: hypothetical protein PLZ54_06695 [Paludibacteraceae bacterium]|nr:hypothetical protein [Paludibacteraceae bacterium]